MQRAQITVVREQGKHLPCRVVDLSPTMCSVTALQPLFPGETVRLSLRDRRMIADVRKCTLDEGYYSIDLERMDDRLGLLRSVALGELFDSVAPRLPQPRSKVTALTFSIAVLTVALAAALILSVSGGLVDQASAGQPKFTAAPAPVAAPDVPDPPPLESSRLAIRATGPSWVTVCADGQKLFERLFQPGDTAGIPFAETAVVRSGNAGGLEVTFGDQPLGLMGQWGDIRMLRATPQGYAYVPPVLSDSCLP